MLTNRKTPSVPAVQRILDVLEVISQSKMGMTLSELAQELKLPKSSAHCLVLTLERRGYLYRNERTARYKFGLKLLELADLALTGIPVRDQAAAVMFALMQTTGLAVHLAVLENREAVLIHKIEPRGSYRLATWIGKRMEMHCTGVGKVFLAHFSETEQDQFIAERGLPRHNEHTIVSVARLKSHLEEVRAQGYALDDEEDELGYRCIGCPVFNAGRQVIAAISLAGDTDQITPNNFLSLMRELIKASASITSTAAKEERFDAGPAPAPRSHVS